MADARHRHGLVARFVCAGRHMNGPGDPSMCGAGRPKCVVAGLGASNSTVGQATTDKAMDRDVADGAHGGPLHAAAGGVEPARSGGNNCTVRHCPRRQCGQHETSMPVVRWRNCAASSQAWGWIAGMPSAIRAWAIRSRLTAGLSNP